MQPLEQYLHELAQLRASGAALPETSGYPALANLLNAIGGQLKPKVTALVQIANSGAGIPDGGFFTPDQLKRSPEDAPLRGLKPARGVIEVKAADVDLITVDGGRQVRDYLYHYGTVLLCNYRSFLLLTRHQPGEGTRGESFYLAESETSFWQLTAHPRKAAEEFGQRLAEFLQRVMLHAAPLDNPEDLAFFLASYARDARVAVEKAPLDALQNLRASLETALGFRVEDERGLHFFRSTLVQTLFYGVFSAWVLWHKERPQRNDRFDWRTAAFNLQLPVLQRLFHELASPARVKDLGVQEPLDWATATLNRVNRPAFFERFADDHAVQYFYEPFLEAFDPQLREEFGVWYTPEEIVRYMVARVDRTLREDFHRPAGLADPDVVVLDPCCGTGAYLVEVLRTIHRYHAEEEALGASQAAQQAKQAARERVFGFELLPAPYVVSHLQLGLLLQKLGAPLDEATHERAAVYLTNALTGWTPTRDPKQIVMRELEAERDAANHVKQDQRILVILGNPPYDGYAGLAVSEERDLSDAYREVRTPGCPEPQGQGLNDLYVRFYRMAERQIAEKMGEGIVCFISNYSWLDGLSHPGMRERFLDAFDSITVDCLNGDKYKTGKLTPEGEPDPSVFSTERNREGIQVGTAVALLVRSSRRKEAPSRSQKTEDRDQKRDRSRAAAAVRFRHFWGKAKRADLEASLKEKTDRAYSKLKPAAKLGLVFVPALVGRAYLKWPKLPELLPVSFPGVKTSRDEVLVEIQRDDLETRMRRYFDPKVSDEEVRLFAPCLMEKTKRFDPKKTRESLRTLGMSSGKVVRYAYRPFDSRWVYWHPATKLLDEKRADYFKQVFAGNVWFSAGQRNRKEDFYAPQMTRMLADHHLVESNVGMFPLYLRQPRHSYAASALHDAPDLFSPRGGNGGGGNAPEDEFEIKPNLTPRAAAYLAGLRTKPEALFFHIVAVLHAPAYRTENAGALRQDWPRVPLPAARAALEASAALGRQIAALLDPETPVPGVTSGKTQPELRNIAVLSGADLRLTAGWGIAGKGGIVMPGKGRLTSRAAAFETSATTVHDVHLNDTTCWQGVSEAVWDYTLGGYQVLKKWLSYREAALLGRALTPDEVREFTYIARRIAALLLLTSELDANYLRVRGDDQDGKP
ncbi:MAG: N-6 DNA methylase [Verrucomicrobia bacterium]|nr:N-6 DNA methylase [Verrucomicrobiota bacterium]